MANKFKEKQYVAEILGRLYSQVLSEEKDCVQDYRRVGVTDVQETHWKTGELLWEDEEKTIPKMRDKWDYVAKSKEDMNEDDYAKLSACQYIKTQLEKML